MIKEEKVIIMSKLALLEKSGINKDLKITNYYPEDYIYIKNFMTRISIFCIIAAGIMGHVLLRMETDIVIPATGEELFIHYIIPYGGITVLVLAFYTLVSTRVYAKQYQKAQERVKIYRQLMKELDELDKVEEEERRMRDGKRNTLNPAG